MISAATTISSDETVIAITTEQAQAGIVVWFTRPGDELIDGGYRAEVGQVTVMGAANSSG